MKALCSMPDSDNEKGMVLIVTMVVSFVLSILAVSLMTTAIYSIKIAGQELRKTKAFYLAEGGIERAKRVLRYSDFNGVLVGADGIAGTSDDGILNFGEGVGFGEGTYSVKIADNDDGDGDFFMDSDSMLMAVSMGTWIGTSSDVGRTLNVLLFGDDASTPKAAIICGGDLMISGNPTVQGLYGSIHANGSIEISGNPVISQSITASGSFTVSGDPVVGGESGSGYDLVPIPPIVPEDFFDLVLDSDPSIYFLRSTGASTGSTTTILAITSANPKHSGGGSGEETSGTMVTTRQQLVHTT